jgi:hypothetical protein
MTLKDRLHQLVDELPDDEVAAAQRYLEYLRDIGTDPVLRAFASAPVNDEPVTDQDRVAIAEACAELAGGQAVPHEDGRRRLLG